MEYIAELNITDCGWSVILSDQNKSDRIFVTVHAKTSLVRTKIEIHFLSPAYSYTH